MKRQACIETRLYKQQREFDMKEPTAEHIARTGRIRNGFPKGLALAVVSLRLEAVFFKTLRRAVVLASSQYLAEGWS